MYNLNQIIEACLRAGVTGDGMVIILRTLRQLDTDKDKRFPAEPKNLNSEHHKLIEESYTAYDAECRTENNKQK